VGPPLTNTLRYNSRELRDMIYTFLLSQDMHTETIAPTLGEKSALRKSSPVVASVLDRHYMQMDYVGAQCHFEIIEMFYEMKGRQSILQE
jgi:hypothetical protein